MTKTTLKLAAIGLLTAAGLGLAAGPAAAKEEPWPSSGGIAPMGEDYWPSTGG
ncbi:hypothetical protein [Microtetraspora malaysiensis]|uniref:hypothetical protein n=1 Tax=Microtetraspora malaysiensis TaxID=161358 RepID=UPI003D902A3E